MACFPSLAEFAPELIVRYLSETNRVGVRLQFNQEATFMQLRDKLLAGEITLQEYLTQVISGEGKA